MSKQCENDAALRYIWPGKDEAFCCIDHAIGIKNIADAMGCPVYFHPITFNVVENHQEFPQCSSFVAEDK